MAYITLVDCYDTHIGATQIARVSAMRRTITRPVIRSTGDYLPGDFSLDRGPWSIAGTMNAQDPLVVPVVLATWSGQPWLVKGRGRDKGLATWKSIQIAHAILTAIGFELADNGPGTSTFAVRNRADETPTLATEAITETIATSVIVPTRATTIKILGATFTPTGSAAVTVPGIVRAAWNARGNVIGGPQSPGSDFENAVDVDGWTCGGSIDCMDFELTTSMPMGVYLSSLYRGSLAITCRVSGQDETGTPPADVVITLPRLKFHDVDDGLASKGDGTSTVQFDQLMRDGATPKNLFDMVTMV